MLELAIYLRCIQLYTHNLHNLVARIPFFADHEFLGELYVQYEGQYDSIIERMIGSGLNPDLLMVQVQAIEKLKKYPSQLSENTKAFEMLLNMEKEICAIIEKINPTVSIGTQQLIGDIANLSESTQYKLQQRIKR